MSSVPRWSIGADNEVIVKGKDYDALHRVAERLRQYPSYHSKCSVVLDGYKEYRTPTCDCSYEQALAEANAVLKGEQP